jgi:hypothetical protein
MKALPTMVFETTTSLAPEAVIDRAISFFGERVPHHAAFPEKRGPEHLVLRGQGGEEIAIAVRATKAGTQVRGSTLMFDHSLDRFISGLPQTEGVG